MQTTTKNHPSTLRTRSRWLPFIAAAVLATAIGYRSSAENIPCPPKLGEIILLEIDMTGVHDGDDQPVEIIEIEMPELPDSSLLILEAAENVILTKSRFKALDIDLNIIKVDEYMGIDVAEQFVEFEASNPEVEGIEIELEVLVDDGDVPIIIPVKIIKKPNEC